MPDWMGQILRVIQAAVRAMLQLFARTRRAVLDVLGGDGLTLPALNETLDMVDLETQHLSRELGDLVAARQAEIAELSQRMVGEVVIDFVAPDITQALVDSLAATRLELVTKIGESLRTALRREVQQGALGLKTPDEVMRAVRDLLDTAGAGTYPARAEAIVRTEVGRAQSQATQQHLEQAQQRGVRVRKQWLHSGNRNPRLPHVAASGQIREVREPFVVNGVRLRYPRDGSAPASETVNCRCIVLPVV